MFQSIPKKERSENSGYMCRLTSAALAFLLGMAVMSVYTHFTVQKQITAVFNSKQQELNLEKNAIKRLHKRSITEKEDESSRTKREASSNMPAAHLIGKTGRTYFQAPLSGDYFLWKDEFRNSFSLMEIEQTNTGTFIVINQSGYYMVYSQVIYNGHGMMLIGHETLRISGRYEYSLMTTLNTQQLATPRSGNAPRRNSAGRSIDSGYQAGIFYLHEGDKIGVKPTQYGASFTYTMGSKGSFFGMYFVHK